MLHVPDEDEEFSSSREEDVHQFRLCEMSDIVSGFMAARCVSNERCDDDVSLPALELMHGENERTIWKIATKNVDLSAIWSEDREPPFGSGVRLEW